MKKFFCYLSLGLLGTAAGIPYILSLLGPSLKNVPYPTPVIALLIMGQTAVVIAIAVFFGLKIARGFGFTTGFIEDKAASQRAIITSVLLGAVTAALITIGDRIFADFLPNLTIGSVKMDTWKLLIVPLYGGTVEELLMRLFFVSFFVWLFSKIMKTTDPVNRTALVWSSITLSAILFGIGHLPATAALTAITPLVVVRAIVLNGIGGMVFGWLYWKKGLPYAIIAHATTDLTLFVIIPFLLQSI